MPCNGCGGPHTWERLPIQIAGTVRRKHLCTRAIGGWQHPNDIRGDDIGGFEAYEVRAGARGFKESQVSGLSGRRAEWIDLQCCGRVGLHMQFGLRRRNANANVLAVPEKAKARKKQKEK